MTPAPVPPEPPNAYVSIQQGWAIIVMPDGITYRGQVTP